MVGGLLVSQVLTLFTTPVIIWPGLTVSAARREEPVPVAARTR